MDVDRDVAPTVGDPGNDGRILPVRRQSRSWAPWRPERVLRRACNAVAVRPTVVPSAPGKRPT
jgi:hypothetical protein